MGWRADQDQDEDRLPQNIQRIGYDADTGVYTYRDTKERSTWEGKPGNRYGVLHKVSNGTRSVSNTVDLRSQTTSKAQANTRTSLPTFYPPKGPPRIGTASEIEGYNDRNITQQLFTPIQSLGRAFSNAVTSAASTTYTAFQTSLSNTKTSTRHRQKATSRSRAVSEPTRHTSTRNDLNRRKSIATSTSLRRQSRYQYESSDSDSDTDSESDYDDFNEKKEEKPHVKHYEFEFEKKRESLYGSQSFCEFKYRSDSSDDDDMSSLDSSSSDEENARSRRTRSQRSTRTSGRRQSVKF